MKEFIYNPFLWILPFFSFFNYSYAQIKGYEIVIEAKVVKEKFNATAKSINSFKAEMIQEKHLEMLQEKLVSKGMFYYQKENKIRIEYNSPFKYLMIINGTKIIIKDNNSKVTKIDAGNNAIFKQINALIIDCVKGSFLDNKDFNIAIYQNKEFYLFQLIPLKKGLKDFFSTIQIYVIKTDYTVQKIIMNENGGDFTNINFKHKTLNIALPPSIFSNN